MTELIFSKYSNERDRRFAIRTDILEEDGVRFLQKTALYPEGRNHVENLPEYEKKLNLLYGTVFCCNRCIDESECETEKTRIRLEYLEGETLEEQLDALLTEDRKEEAKELLLSYLNQVKELHDQIPFAVSPQFQEVFGKVEIPKGETASYYMNIDMVCENLIRGEITSVLDYEWTFFFPIPCKFLLYRIIFYYFSTNKKRAMLNAEEFYQSFGISEVLRQSFEKMEQHFQNYITGKHVPVREMYASITPGVSVVKTVASSQFQVYFSFGDGYAEENSRLYPIYGENLSVEIELPQKVKDVRIDPGDHPCSIQIHELSFDGKPADLTGVVIQKGFLIKNWVHIAKSDPGMEKIPVPEGSRKMKAELSIYPVSEERMESIWKVEKQNRHLRAQNEKMSTLIKEMRNTKVWKAYQTYRNLVEKKKRK